MYFWACLLLWELCCCSVAKSCPTLCDPIDCSTPGSSVLHCLPGLLKLMSIESVMLSNHLFLCRPLLLLPLIFPSSVELLSHFRTFATPWTTARQASLSITNSRSLLKLMSIESMMPFISSSVIPFSSCHQSFPASGSFPMSQFFTSNGQSIGASASASVLPVNIQDWLPLGRTGWISLQSKGPSRVFSNTIVQKNQFFGAQLSL